MKKITLSIVTSAVLTSSIYGADLGSISIESSTIDTKVEVEQTEASSTETISSKEIENITAQSVSDILNTVPGVSLTLSGTDSLKVHIRGIDNQMYMGEKPGVAIVIDGVPVQETSGKINVDLDNIESIKVIKGSASYLYGNDAIGGAVVIRTKRQKGDKNSSKVETEVGSFGYKKFVVSTNQVFENGALQLQGSYRDTDGYWDDAFVTVKSVNGKYQHYLNDNSDVTVGIDISKRDTGDGNSVSGITEAQNDPESKNSKSYSGYYDTTLTKAFVTYSNDVDDDSNVMLRVHSYKDDKSNKTARFTKDRSEIWDQNGAKGEYRTKVNSFALMAGFDIQKNDTDEESHLIEDNSLTSDYKTKETIKALYTEVKHQTTNNLITTLNIRHDQIDHEYNGVDIGRSTTTQTANPSYDITSYRFGANYSLNELQTIYASLASGFRTPSVTQTATNQSSLLDDPTLDIPSVIDVENTYNYEVGLKGNTNGDLVYNGSIYQLDRKNYIGRIAGSYITSDEEDESNYDNVGDMRSRGFELSIGSKQEKTFSYNLAYTFLDAKFTNYTISQQITKDPDGRGPLTASFNHDVDFSGNYIPRTSKHTINLRMNYKINKQIDISPEIYFKSSYYADEANKFKQDGYEVVNLKTNYSQSKSLDFYFKITNLLDKDYYQFVTVNSSTLATMEDATIRVGEPRAYYAGLRYKF